MILIKVDVEEKNKKRKEPARQVERKDTKKKE
jgi:hypothetical protein